MSREIFGYFGVFHCFAALCLKPVLAPCKEEVPTGAGGAPVGSRGGGAAVGFSGILAFAHSVGGFCGDGAGGGAYGEPLGGAGDSAQGTSPFGGADGGVSLFGKRGGLGLFVV